MRRAGHLLPVALLAGCAVVSGLFPPKPPEDLSAAALKLPSSESLAAGIALEDLLRLERAETAELGGLAPDGGIREPDDGGTPASDGGWRAVDAFMARCFQDPSTYQVWVDKPSARHLWKVVLLPMAPCTQNVIGGGAEYEIDADSFKILKRERFE